MNSKIINILKICESQKKIIRLNTNMIFVNSNIDKLKFTDNRGLPIYYSADWDYDGLLIFNMIKKIIPNIKLLYPTA